MPADHLTSAPTTSGRLKQDGRAQESPYAAAPLSIPVTLFTSSPVPPALDAAILRLAPSLHNHAPGTECIACAARSDVRAVLFDLLQKSRAEGKPLRAVAIDATALPEPGVVAARLDPTTPAFGLRDHTVLRSFHLQSIV